MTINLSNIARTIHTINNPNRPWGALIVEVPTDVGRSYQGYRRGGLLECAEKFRKEVMAAAVWLLGIPAFKSLGDKFCEKILKLPMNIDFALDDIKQGNTPVKDSIEFLTKKTKEEAFAFLEEKKLKDDFFDASELIQKYFKNRTSVFAGQDSAKLIKNLKNAKIATSIIAFCLNAFALGVVLPKINQALTRRTVKKIEKENSKNKTLKVDNFSEYRKKFTPTNNQNQSSKANNISYKGSISFFKHPLAVFTDAIENSNNFRLIAPDAPMIGGRTLTSRNGYEALENGIVDVAGIFLYNYCSDLIQKIAQNKTNNPSISPTLSEITAALDENTIKNAIEKLKDNDKIFKTQDLLGKQAAQEIYKIATYGKYGKINKLVKKETLERIDAQLCEFLRKLAKENKDLSKENILKFTKNVNSKNAMFLILGSLTAIIGQAWLVPKFAYKVTELLTGKNEFSGLAHYDNKKQK